MGGIVVNAIPLAVQEGVRILKKGGNAVDAAVTAALVGGVAAPEMCGIGGEGTMQVFLKSKGEHKQLDGLCRAGSKASPSIWEGRKFDRLSGGTFVVDGLKNIIGYQSVCVPGESKVLHEALTRYGTMSWKQVCQPAINIARAGCLVDQRTAWFFSDYTPDKKYPSGIDRLRMTPAARRIYLKSKDEPYRCGELLSNPEYAETLSKIAERGPDALYSGEIASKVASDFERNDGLLVEDDLRNYKIDVYNPLSRDYEGFSVASNRPPGCGITLIEMLNIVGEANLQKFDRKDPKYLHLLAQVMKRAYIDRYELVGDANFVEVPLSKLASRTLDLKSAMNEPNEPWMPKFPVHQYTGTTTNHLSVMDDQGNAVSYTQTLGSASGVIMDDLGYEFNNNMAWFHPLPGTPNSIAPGKAPVVGLTPTLVFKDGEPVLSIGGSGGWRISFSVFQAIINIFDHKMTLEDSIAAPRIDCMGDDLHLEEGIPESAQSELAKKGYSVVDRAYPNYQYVLVQGAGRNESGKLVGGTDRRGNGLVGFC